MNKIEQKVETYRISKHRNRNFGMFIRLQKNTNVTYAQEAKFQASKLEKALRESFLWVSLNGVFSVFCEARLAFALERNADFLHSKQQVKKPFLFPLEILIPNKA